MNVAKLTDPYFLDTNLFVYSFDSSAPAKQSMARELIRHALSTRRGLISTQVAQEFLNVASRKFASQLSIPDRKTYLSSVLTPLCQHYPSMRFYDHALLLQQETGYAFYDVLIVTAAVELKCVYLLSEDMQAGHVIRNLTILNPFGDE